MAAIEFFQRISKRRFFRYGVPFVLTIIGGSYTLRHFSSIRYEFRQSRKITNQEAEKFGIKMKKDNELKSLEEIYEENVEKSDLDNWENVRGPRPWEDSKTVQDLQRKSKSEAS